MKTILFLAAALLLAGCETEEGWVPGETATAERVPPRAPTAPPIVPTPPPYTPPAPVMAAAPPARAPIAPPAPVATEPPPEMAAAAPAPADAHCQAVARQRAADARANGYSFEMADTIYNGTYKDCASWDSQHGPAR